MEKAKAFFLICAGILMLSIAMDIGTEKARADFDPSAGGPVIASFSNGNTLYALLETGECWEAFQSDNEWVRAVHFDPPVPLSDIAFWEWDRLIATNGDFWYRGHSEWINMGAPPQGTPAGSSSWSQLKSSFGK